MSRLLANSTTRTHHGDDLPSKLLLLGAILVLIGFLFRPGRPLAELGILRDRFGR